MKALPSLLLLISFSYFAILAESILSYNYYDESCPKYGEVIQQTVTDKQTASPATAGGLLRLHFYDCFVNGCDASILLSSTPFNSAERDAYINLSVDAFELVSRVKTDLQLSCPDTVSCADILAVATRDLVTMTGGPFYNVPLGRKDYRISKSASVAGNLPTQSMTMTELIKLFRSKGFSIQEMVALTGAHTIGVSHCSDFKRVMWNATGYNPIFAQGLREACSNYQKDPTISVFNDIITPNKFDNMYFQNLPKGLGVLDSDHALYDDPSTRPFVVMYAEDQERFFRDFAKAMEKLSVYGVKTGRRGEIRRRCDAVN